MSGINEIPSIIERGLPNAVTYDLTAPNYVTITLPPKSAWSSGLHWHENHTEYLKVIKGSIALRLGNVERVVSATEDNQPEIRVDRYVWHEWQRAEVNGEEAVVIERTDPEDGEKAIFFWNLNGVILNAATTVKNRLPFLQYGPTRLMDFAMDFWITLNLFIIFRSLDNFPVILNAVAMARQSGEIDNTSITQQVLILIDWAASHIILGASSFVGRLLKLSPVRVEYTPIDVYNRWHSNHGKLSLREKNL